MVDSRHRHLPHALRAVDKGTPREENRREKGGLKNKRKNGPAYKKEKWKRNSEPKNSIVQRISMVISAGRSMAHIEQSPALAKILTNFKDSKIIYQFSRSEEVPCLK